MVEAFLEISGSGLVWLRDLRIKDSGGFRDFRAEGF